MNPFLQQLFFQKLLRQKKEGKKGTSKYIVAREFLRFKSYLKTETKSYLFIAIGVISAAFALESFLLPAKFIDGGVTGISLLISELSGWQLPILIVLLNIPFIILGLKQVGKDFAFKTSIGVIALALVVTFWHFPIITSDKLLVAVFGGFFLGIGIGLAVRGGGVLDGTEVLALFVGKKLGITIGDVILAINILIFSCAAALLSIETALYSMLTYISASKTVDFIIEGIEEYTGVSIISTRPDEIRKMIINDLGRGVTIYLGKRGFNRHGENLQELDIVYTVVTRLELTRLNNEIALIDPNAFIIMNSVKDAKGGMIKKRPLK
ncbi:MAG: YitT family protein [Bacteroidota bacterium]